MTVMIGVDPHKGSHTAVAIDGDEVAAGVGDGARGASQLERVARLGGTVRGPDVGDRVGGWARLSARAAARRRG